MRLKPFTTFFIIVNVVVYLWMLHIYGTTETHDALYSAGAMFGADALPNIRTEWPRLFTANFIHIGQAHLISNMISLYIFGTALEELVGGFKFILIYILTGVAGAASVMYFDPMTLTAGASTSIFGLFGAFLVYTIIDRNLATRRLGGQFVTYIWVTLAFNLYNTFASSGISIYGHLGGLVAGVFLGMILTPKGCKN